MTGCVATENAVEMPMDEMNSIRVDDTTGVKVDQELGK